MSNKSKNRRRSVGVSNSPSVVASVIDFMPFLSRNALWLGLSALGDSSVGGVAPSSARASASASASAIASNHSLVSSRSLNNVTLSWPAEGRKVTPKRSSAIAARMRSMSAGRLTDGKATLAPQQWSRSRPIPVVSCRWRSLATRRPGGRRSLLLGRLHASPEGGHELYGAVGKGRRLEKLLSLQLGLDDLHQRLSVLVAVASRVERPREELDEGESHSQLLLGDLHRGRLSASLHPDLVGVEERLQHQGAVQRTQDAQPLLVTDRYLGHGGQPFLSEGAQKQGERFLAQLLGLEVVALLVEHGVDLPRPDEAGKLDRLLAGQRQLLEVVLAHDDVLVPGVLIAPNRLAPLDRALARRTQAQLFEAAAALLVQQVTGAVLALGGRIELHRNTHHPEADDAAPDRPRH